MSENTLRAQGGVVAETAPPTLSEQVRGMALAFFQEHPAARDEVMKSYYAFHASPADNELAHRFTSSQRYSPCINCGRTREAVRYDDQPPACENPQPLPDIAAIIQVEEVKALKLQASVGKVLARKLNGELSGEKLAQFYQTDGLRPEQVCDELGVKFSDYQAGYEVAVKAHQLKSQKALKRKVVTCE